MLGGEARGVNGQPSAFQSLQIRLGRFILGIRQNPVAIYVIVVFTSCLTLAQLAIFATRMARGDEPPAPANWKRVMLSGGLVSAPVILYSDFKWRGNALPVYSNVSDLRAIGCCLRPANASLSPRSLPRGRGASFSAPHCETDCHGHPAGSGACPLSKSGAACA